MTAPAYKSVRIHKATHQKLKRRALELEMPINKLIDRLYAMYAREA